jgi:hypothetical protein
MRRRRSVARSPALVDPADLPEDAPGRVALIAIRAPEDTLEGPLETTTGPSHSPLAAGWLPGLITALDGWLVVILIAALLLVVFTVGMALAR